MTLPDRSRLRGFCGVLAAAALLTGACSRKEDHTPAAPVAGAHAHVAPHGGTLIEIGDHQFAMELVHDAAAGRLTAYVLDAHAEKFVRLPLPGFTLVALVNGRPESLTMAAVANPATGETVGDTSEFATEADWMRGRVAFDAYIPTIEIRGATFTDVRFAFRSKPAK